MKEKFVKRWLRNKILDLSFELTRYLVGVVGCGTDRCHISEHNFDFKLKEIMSRNETIDELDLWNLCALTDDNNISFVDAVIDELDTDTEFTSSHIAVEIIKIFNTLVDDILLSEFRSIENYI